MKEEKVIGKTSDVRLKQHMLIYMIENSTHRRQNKAFKRRIAVGSGRN